MGMGFQYTHKKAVFGISLDFGWTHILADVDSPEESIFVSDELSSSEFAALSLFANYEITGFNWWDFLWFKYLAPG